MKEKQGIGTTALIGIIVIVVIIVAIIGVGAALSATTTSSHSTATSVSSSSSSSDSSTSSSQITTSITASSSSYAKLQSASNLEDGNAVCTSVNDLPDPTCTPGATNSNVTQSDIYSTICVSGWTSTVRPPTSYTNPLKVASIQDYKYNDTYLGDYEEDHLIPLELGGSPTSVYNLWAEPHQGNYTSYQKDALENNLNAQVCDGKMQLVQAQQEIATNWVQFWQLYEGGSTASSSITISNSSSTTSLTSTNQSSSVQISYFQNPIVRGGTQVIYIATNPMVANSLVNVSVTYASGYNRDFNTQTNSSGKASVNWTIGANSDPGTFQVLVTINGKTYSSSFQVDS